MSSAAAAHCAHGYSSAVAAAAAAAAGWSSTTAPGWSNKQLPPVVKIDNASDAFATVVSVELGDEGTLEMLGMVSTFH
eukprot:356724-Chlamydomonas_euryale.AAC.4